jgi:hypothetical protein
MTANGYAKCTQIVLFGTLSATNTFVYKGSWQSTG